jgi:hypothetical protein
MAPWGRLDDSLYDHPKVERLPARLRNSCVGLMFRAISWSNRHLTDGFVPTATLRKLDGRASEVDALVAVGLLDPADGGVTIHDFLDYSPSAADVKKKRAEMKELGKRGGQRSAEARRFNRDASNNAWTDGESDGSSDGEDPRFNSRPVPSRPVPAETRPAPGSSPDGAIPRSPRVADPDRLEDWLR